MGYTVDRPALTRCARRLASDAEEVTGAAGAVPAAPAAALAPLVDAVLLTLTARAVDVATRLDDEAAALRAAVDVATHVDGLSATDLARLLPYLDDGEVGLHDTAPHRELGDLDPTDPRNGPVPRLPHGAADGAP